MPLTESIGMPCKVTENPPRWGGGIPNPTPLETPGKLAFTQSFKLLGFDVWEFLPSSGGGGGVNSTTSNKTTIDVASVELLPPCDHKESL